MYNVHIDIETYSPEPITNGVHKYSDHPDFEVLIISFSYDYDLMTGKPEVKRINMYDRDEEIWDEFCAIMEDPSAIYWAHNAQFERVCLRRIGFETKITSWRCTKVLSYYAGFPGRLEHLSKILKLGDAAKSKAGKALINKFSIPRKPTKKDPRTRIFPFEEPEAFEEFGDYCDQDVVAEIAVHDELKDIHAPQSFWDDYHQDQRINDYGMPMNRKLVRRCYEFYRKLLEDTQETIKELTGVDNPRSNPQMKAYYEKLLGKELKSISKDNLKDLVEEGDQGYDQFKILQDLSADANAKSPTKYIRMLDAMQQDDRVRGAIEYYGAYRTGRYAGRIFQPHNMTKNKSEEVFLARELILDDWSYEEFSMMYPVVDTLSEIIRSSISVKDSNKSTFLVADFSAIEARTLAWLVNCEWKLEVFRTHGKIYEAVASKMFNVPLESITKDSDHRAKGKIGELALGYGGASGALSAMSAEAAEWSESVKISLVKTWRDANPEIVEFWYDINKAVMDVVKTKKRIILRNYKNLEIYTKKVGKIPYLAIKLPSGRCLHYPHPTIGNNKFGNEAFKFRKYTSIGNPQVEDSWGGTLTENIIQAIARDLLVYSMHQLEKEGYNIFIHVHDEAGAEIEINESTNIEEELKKYESIVKRKPVWADGLPLNAEGFASTHYKK